MSRTAPSGERCEIRCRRSRANQASAGELLLQPQPAGKPCRRGIIEVEGEAELGQQTRQEVTSANVGQLVGQDCPALIVTPRPPVLRQQDRIRLQPTVAGVQVLRGI